MRRAQRSLALRGGAFLGRSRKPSKCRWQLSSSAKAAAVRIRRLCAGLCRRLVASDVTPLGLRLFLSNNVHSPSLLSSGSSPPSVSPSSVSQMELEEVLETAPHGTIIYRYLNHRGAFLATCRSILDSCCAALYYFLRPHIPGFLPRPPPPIPMSLQLRVRERRAPWRLTD